MMGSMPMFCPACNAPVSTGGGRCPSCGEMLPEAPPGPQQPRPYEPSPSYLPPSLRPRPKPPSNVPVVAAAVGALALAGVGGWLIMSRDRHDEGGPKAAVSTATAAPLPTTVPGEIDPSAALSSARKKASAWHADAGLVSISVTGMSGGRIDGSGGGKVEFTFAKPESGLGPGARASADQLLVSVDSDGTHDSPTKGAAAGRLVAEPNCPVDEAWRKMVASGVPSTAKVILRYQHSDKHGRDVWQSTAEDDKQARVLDGNSCSILVR